MIATLGEALVDLVGDGTTFHAVAGGSPANVAVGLARLGTPVTMLARVSTDRFGRRLREHLTGNGVSDRFLVTAVEPTTLAVVTVGEEGSPHYDFYRCGTADWQWRPEELPNPLPGDVLALHTGSLALALPPGAAVLEEFLRRERQRGRVTVSFDPNIRPQLEAGAAAARGRVERQVALAHVVKVSEEDLYWLYPGGDPTGIAARWLGLGPALVVVTLGARGAVASTREGAEVRVAAAHVEVVDTVGAGDAFTAGLLDGLRCRGMLGPAGGELVARLADEDLADVLRRAGTTASLTCARQGADPPSRADVQIALSRSG